MKQEVFNQYVDKVISLFNINKEEIFKKKKRRDIVDARQMLYYLCHKRPMQINYIQKFMRDSGYDVSHSSIIHGINNVSRKVLSDKDYLVAFKDIVKAV
jgi:chromosomal replication initiation ATPase DnaA